LNGGTRLNGAGDSKQTAKYAQLLPHTTDNKLKKQTNTTEQKYTNKHNAQNLQQTATHTTTKTLTNKNHNYEQTTQQL